ncbi:hypothetical protein [Wolbachia endosymbiont of Chironomus riparius]|uniref:hypothetical protein n=1 Tax=Wolbachia endosymbiont of Chironomus riparius TaxID=2883238 RepID=UPI0020A0D19F|nr:hypothetical protein [Wolbachia endosymbiont of Chironomus riparius]
MKSVNLRFLIFLLFAYQGNADCPPLVKSNTALEIAANQTGKGAANFFILEWSNLAFDEKVLQYIRVEAVKDQGIYGNFNPRIKVCDYEGENCSELYGGTSCHNIYGTQGSGAGVSAAVFIDWEGDKTVIGSKIAQTLEWEWANGVEEKDKKKFAKSPKICACTQKGACMSGISAWFSRVVSGENIFRPGDMENVCDTCEWDGRQQKIKCAPISLLPGPPPFCDQLECSLPQVRIVPISINDNDYFDPRIGVMVGGESKIDLHIRDEYPEQHIKDKDGNIFYFKTYKKEGELCAEYYGNQGVNEKNLQFTRCFPSPPAPHPEVLQVVGNNTLEIQMKMSEKICVRLIGGNYNGGNKSCTFSINTRPKKIGHISLKVVKPEMNKTINNTLDETLKNILSKNKEFQILQRYGCVPAIDSKCEILNGKCELDSTGHIKTEFQYKEKEIKDQGKMLCASGWQPEPEEFMLEREGEMIPLKLMSATYAKYNTVYSKESKQMYYFPLDKINNILEHSQDQLNDIVFDKKGYIIIPKDNEGRNMCIVEKDEELDKKKDSDECRIVYKLIDSEYKEACKPGDDGCIKDNNYRYTRYVRKDNNQPFFLRRVVGKDDKVESQEVPVRVNRAEVFYPEKLCKFDLQELKKKLNETILAQLKAKKTALEGSHSKIYALSGSAEYTDDLSNYKYVEIEAWGGGEAGHIKNKAHSQESRLGMPGDYIKAKLKIDLNYPLIKVKVTEGGGNQEEALSNKDGGPTIIEMCEDDTGRNCKELITVAGGGRQKIYGNMKDIKTIIHQSRLKVKEKIVRGDDVNSTQDNQVAYIKTGKIKYKKVNKCNSNIKANEYGAGGCIDKSNMTYSKGSAGHAVIKPILGEIKVGEIPKFIEKVTNDEIPNIDDPLINKLDPDIAKTIKQEIEKALSCKSQAQPGAN